MNVMRMESVLLSGCTRHKRGKIIQQLRTANKRSDTYVRSARLFDPNENQPATVVFEAFRLIHFKHGVCEYGLNDARWKDDCLQVASMQSESDSVSSICGAQKP